MGNHRFRLSDMMPNAWFYKLKYMNRVSTNHTLSPPTKGTHHARPRTPTSPIPLEPSPLSIISNRTSYYYPSKPEQHLSTSPSNHRASHTHFPLDPPRKSKRKTSRKPTNPSTKLLNTSVSATCSCRLRESESITNSNSPFFNQEADLYQPIITNFAANINMDLPPILTKPKKKDVSTNLKHQIKSAGKRMYRFRVRASSPRLTGKARRSSGLSPVATRQRLSESFAVVKTSSDPQRDFMDSMVEMIIENNIRSSKDLEEMLACYLALNSNEYHDVIVKVFEQIWFQLAEIIML